MSSSRFDDPLPVDPELRELLREISARQESRLLHAQVPRSPAALFEADTAIRASATGLIAAERELLTRYREEVACLLRRLAREAIRGSESLNHLICDYISPSRQAGRHGIESLRGRLEMESEKLAHGFPEDSASLHILECASLGVRLDAAASTLALASLRLEPHDDARIYLALELMHGGSRRASLETFARIAREARTAAQRACAYSWQGVLLGRDGDYRTAAWAQSEATRLDSSPPAHPFNWLVYSAQAEDICQLVEAARLVDDSFDPGDQALNAWLDNARQQRSRGEWIPPTRSRELARRHAEAHGPATRRLLNVFS